MLPCGVCDERFSSNDALRVHLEGHASQLFDSDEEPQENEFKTERDLDQDSDEASLVFDYVKEKKQLQGQGQQEESRGEKDSVAPSEEAADGRHTLRERESTSKALNCSKCSYQTTSKYWFKRHMNVMHLNKFKCDHCPKRYPSKGRLDNHIRKEHMKDEDKPKLPEDELFRITRKQGYPKTVLYKCLECTFKNRNRTQTYLHIRGVHKNRLEELYKSKGMIMDDAAYHKCTECFYKTLFVDALKLHIKAIHQKRRDYICDLCKKAFPAKSSLSAHMKSVHMSFESLELHKCSICTYKTIQKSHLKEHLNVVHLKIRNFTCDLCQKKFSWKCSIREHIERNHLVLSCNRGRNCFFRTTEKQELSRHIQRVHQKIKGFSCKVCGKWYSSRNGLSAHKQNHSMEGNKLTCNLCQTTTKNRQMMHQHMKGKHLKKETE